MERLMGQGNKDNFLNTVAQYEEWMKKKKEEQDKADKDKKSKEKPKPPTFTVAQVFLILTGLGPIIGSVAMQLEVYTFQMALDAVRSIH